MVCSSTRHFTASSMNLALIALFVDIGYPAALMEAGMDPETFERWVSGIASLTDPQRRSVWQALALAEAAAGPGADTPAAAEPTLTRAKSADRIQPASPPAPPLAARSGGTASVADLGQCRVASLGCPHCGDREVVRWGRASDLPRYRCKACSRTFNALTKTPLANLRLKDKWPTQAEAMIDGVSLAQAARRCGVHPSTAFRWRHRFLAALSGDKPKALSGIVEGDETFILESFKGKRSGLPRKSRKRGGKSAKRGLSAEQIPIIVARDRHGATTDAVLSKLIAYRLPRLWAALLRQPMNSAAMAAQRSLPSRGAPGLPRMSCQSPASPRVRRRIITSIMSTPTTAD
jgi:transposase-like protein